MTKYDRRVGANNLHQLLAHQSIVPNSQAWLVINDRTVVPKTILSFAEEKEGLRIIRLSELAEAIRSFRKST